MMCRPQTLAQPKWSNCAACAEMVRHNSGVRPGKNGFQHVQRSICTKYSRFNVSHPLKAWHVVINIELPGAEQPQPWMSCLFALGKRLPQLTRYLVPGSACGSPWNVLETGQQGGASCRLCTHSLCPVNPTKAFISTSPIDSNPPHALIIPIYFTLPTRRQRLLS